MVASSLRRVLIAGGSGMVGRGIVKHLNAYYPSLAVRATFHRQTDCSGFGSNTEYIACDLRDLEQCRDAASGCDAAIMAAAVTGGIAQNTEHPCSQMYDNIAINMNILKAFHQAGLQRIVFIGSAICYQPMERSAREEDLDLNIDPPFPYMGVGWVYRYLEKLCAFWRLHSSMEIVSLRASNIFGPYSNFASATSTFIPALIRKAVAKETPFEVWGNPAVTRNVIYVDEFAAKVTAVLLHPEFTSATYNIGAEDDISVGKAVECILRYTKHNVKPVFCQGKYRGVKSRSIDVSKLAAHISVPTVPTDDAIRKTIDWWKENRSVWRW